MPIDVLLVMIIHKCISRRSSMKRVNVDNNKIRHSLRSRKIVCMAFVTHT